MTIAAIIMALLSIFGPLIGELLKKWLDKLLNKAASGMTGVYTNGAVPAVSTELLAKAIDLTPRRQVFRRILLKRIRDAAPGAVLTGKISKEDAQELRALASVSE